MIKIAQDMVGRIYFVSTVINGNNLYETIAVRGHAPKPDVYSMNNYDWGNPEVMKFHSTREQAEKFHNALCRRLQKGLKGARPENRQIHAV